MKRKRKKNAAKRLSFSKLILTLVMISYFITLGIGIYVVVKMDTSQLYALLTFVGAPVAVAIGFYYEKAKKENMKGGITYDTALNDMNKTPDNSMG